LHKCGAVVHLFGGIWMKPAKEYDYYKILGVQYYASQEEIREAFDRERRVLPYNIDDARRKRALLDEAYFVLGNENRRYNYDQSQLNRRKKLQFANQQPTAQSIITLITTGMTRLKTGVINTHVDYRLAGEGVNLRVNKATVMIMLFMLIVFTLAATLPDVYDEFAEFAEPDVNKEAKVLTYISPGEMPPNGQTRCYQSDDPVAPLVIDSAAGGINYLIKLVDADDDKKVVTIFVRGGERVQTQIPLGYYELRYASGKEWYGEELLFGKSTIYMKAFAKLNFHMDGGEIIGQKISLISQIDQGLHLERIKPDEF
jgi:hypothetical protein